MPLNQPKQSGTAAEVDQEGTSNLLLPRIKPGGNRFVPEVGAEVAEA